MGKAKNKVIAGDFIGAQVYKKGADVCIDSGGMSPICLNRESVEEYEVVTDEHRKSAASGVARGLVGAALLGQVGMIAGSLSAKSKGIYQVAIQFKYDRKSTYSEKRSLIEIDDSLYKILVKNCF